MLKQGIEGKWGYLSNVSKNIVKQGIEVNLGYFSNVPIGVISPMSKTRWKQGVKDKWGDISNVSRTIMKQGIEGNLGYYDNGPIAIGKSYFEGGMTNYAQKWETAEIFKRKSSQGLHTEKKHQNCGAPPPQGD